MDWESKYKRIFRAMRGEFPSFRLSFEDLPLIWKVWRSLSYRPTRRDLAFLSPTSWTLYIDPEEWNALSEFDKYGQACFLRAYLRQREELGSFRFYLKHFRPKSRDELLSYCYFEVVKAYVERFVRLSHFHLVRLVDLMWIDFDIASRSTLYVWVRKVSSYLRNHPDYLHGNLAEITLDSLGDHGKL